MITASFGLCNIIDTEYCTVAIIAIAGKLVSLGLLHFFSCLLLPFSYMHRYFIVIAKGMEVNYQTLDYRVTRLQNVSPNYVLGY